MKGRTTCPDCGHQFVIEVSKEEKKDVVCPKCKNEFTIRPKKNNKEGCSWEEHGEPRKTVLSSIKPKTNKPDVVAILLITVFCIGIVTAVFSNVFISNSMEIASKAGFKGSIELNVYNQSDNSSIQNVSVAVFNQNNSEVYQTNETGYLNIQDVSLGLTKINLSHSGYKNISMQVLILPLVPFSEDVEMKKGSGIGETESFSFIGCSLVLVIFSIFALLGGVSALRRKNIDVAIAGSIIGIFSVGFFMIGAILSVISLIIILTCREEFKDGKKGKIF